jgi:citronellol/citronellal dehydrogenase
MNAVTTGYGSVFRPGGFEGSVAVVTGLGIGRCTAHEWAYLGAMLVLVGRDRLPPAPLPQVTITP